MKKIILILVLLFGYANSIIGQDYCWYFRWVNINEQKFYTAGFSIPLTVQSNLDDYLPTTPSPCPDMELGPGCFQDTYLFPDIIVQAASKWNFHYPSIYIQGSASGNIIDAYDGLNKIGFDFAGEIPFDPLSNILGFCRPYLTQNAHVCDENSSFLQPYLTLYGFDIVINPYKNFDMIEGYNETHLDYDAYDFESFVLHELGHALGLCHPPSANQNTDVMSGSLVSASI
ncbi:MAG TPA: hypothetical protein PK239_00290 [Chitinophagales bacterium]|nr:hypothetical protein [Chitinophagales bacterium]